MASKSVELREQRNGIVVEARAKFEAAEAREGGATAADEAEFDRAMDGAEKLLAQAKRYERLESVEDELDRPGERRSAPIDGINPRGGDGASESRKVKADYRRFLTHGEIRENLRADQNRLSAELRDSIAGTDAKGGYLVAPVSVTEELVKAIDDEVFIRKLATVRKVKDAKKLGVRKMSTRMGDANWTTEVQAVTEDTTAAFGRRDLEPNLLSKLAKVSMRLLSISTDAEQVVNDELVYKFGITQEKAFLTGDGSAKPLGAFTADANGISTGRDVSTGNTTTAITADNLIEVKYSIKQSYLKDKSASWIFHRDAVKRIRKLKVSSSGGNDLEYLWQPGLTEGAPDRILDIPYAMSEYAPNTFTTGLYVGILGCWRFYQIAEVDQLVIQRLTELYAGTNEIGFIGRIWVDGAPILEEAFARVKLA